MIGPLQRGVGVLTPYGGVSEAGEPVWLPSDISDLVVWFSVASLAGTANGASVSSWPARYGFGGGSLTGPSGAEPTFYTGGFNGSYPCVSFDGVNDYMYGEWLGMASYNFGTYGETSFIVMNLATATEEPMMSYARNNTTSDKGMSIYGTTSSSMKQRRSNGSSTTTQTFSDSITATAPRILSFRYNGTSAKTVTFKDAVSGSTSTKSYSFGEFNSPVAMIVGCRGTHRAATHDFGSLGVWCRVNICEMLTWNRALTDGERTDVETYLAEQYGL